MTIEPDLVIEPRRGKHEPLLPDRAVLVPNPAEAGRALRRFAPHQGMARTLYQTEIRTDRHHQFCIAGPALGAPAATLVVERMIALGVRHLWLASCCGSLDPALAIGDVLLGTGAVSGEGVSGYYSSSPTASADAGVAAGLRRVLGQRGIAAAAGVLWSTDAPFRERRSELLGLRERYGVVGVDMEYSALLTVARFRNIGCAGLFVVSDELWRQRWRPGFDSAAFRERSELLLDVLVDGAASAAERGDE